MKLPKPPQDLWEQLGSIRSESVPPEGAFNTRDYAARFGIGTPRAYKELCSMERLGKVRKAGEFNGVNYYTLVN